MGTGKHETEKKKEKAESDEDLASYIARDTSDEGPALSEVSEEPVEDSLAEKPKDDEKKKDEKKKKKEDEKKKKEEDEEEEEDSLAEKPKDDEKKKDEKKKK